MARHNDVYLIGKVASKAMEPRIVKSKKTDGESAKLVLNFLVECEDQEDGRAYRLPIAVWGEDEIDQCKEYLKYGDLVLIQGELRYKFRHNEETGKLEAIYTAVKATTVEFLTKKLKGEKLDYSKNEVKLVGNLVHDPVISEKGFVVAIDRLYPTKEVKKPTKEQNRELTDYVTLIVDSKEKIKGNLKKGSMVIVEGKLMTRKKQENVVIPTIVVDVKEIIGR